MAKRTEKYVKDSRGGPGRRVFTPAKKAQFLTYVREGNTQNCAARLVKVGVATVARERVRDKDFRIALKHAEAEFERFHVLRFAAGGKTWVPSAAILERKYRRWRRIQPGQKVEVNTTITKTTVKQAFDYDQLRRDLERFAAESSVGGRVSPDGDRESVHPGDTN